MSGVGPELLPGSAVLVCWWSLGYDVVIGVIMYDF